MRPATYCGGPFCFMTLKYLGGYPATIHQQVQDLIAQDQLGALLRKRYDSPHGIRTDGALYTYVLDLKNTYLRNADPLSKVAFDNKLQVVKHALGTHTTISRVQGTKLKTKREIRIASLFRDAPLPFLRMITVHELAHMKEREHDKAFYKLCTHMEPDYHRLELDVRLYLTHRELSGTPLWVAAGSAPAIESQVV